ncbi:hypothetical protein Dda3937_04635 [Dickeya dadantii 3937]|uniref:Uncharacterized protein n=1 Tax=Dickeya dadantii (strain 3937) TaxID=198628 RepID=E0SIN9_DICD3|nr:hypothetical protein Dda3937_04635 [Dickeya dadantii 3937]
MLDSFSEFSIRPLPMMLIIIVNALSCYFPDDVQWFPNTFAGRNNSRYKSMKKESLRCFINDWRGRGGRPQQ